MKNALLQILIFLESHCAITKKNSIIFGIVLDICFLSKNKRNRFSMVNIKLCFPNLDSNSRYKSIKNIILFGRVVFDTGIAWFWSDNRINKNISYKINGLDLLQRYQKLNKGFVF